MAGHHAPGPPLSASVGRAGLVINPRAWANSRSPTRRAALRRAFAPLGEVAETDHPDELPLLLRRWRRERVALVAISGGDGTAHATLNALLDAWDGASLPALLFIHGGTIGVATHLCPHPAVTLARIATGRPVPLRLVEALQVGQRAAFTFGVGLFAELPAAYAEAGARGRWAVRWFGLRCALSAVLSGPLSARMLRGWRGEVRLDGASRGACTLAGLYASTLDHGALPRLPGFDRPRRPAGHLRVVALPSAAEAAASIAPLATGHPARVELPTRVDLVPAEPGIYMVDGEVLPFEGALSITAGVRLRVVG